VWLPARTFARIGGMDERFSGWGGEDQDFIWRIARHVPLRRYSDPMTHLNHARAPHRAEDGRPFHAEIRFCSWPGDSAIGALRKYLHY
jgi:predicted glycosyltransferase involved in capsule biosynthesis